MVRLKDICTMTKEKTARLIPNAIQLCTDNEKVKGRAWRGFDWSMEMGIKGDAKGLCLKCII